MTITLDTLTEASSTDIYNSDEYVTFRRRDDPSWAPDSHTAECNGCAADLIDRAAFRTYLEGTPSPELTTDQLDAIHADALEMHAERERERAALLVRYTLAQWEYNDDGSPYWGIVDHDRPGYFANVSQREDRAREVLAEFHAGRSPYTYFRTDFSPITPRVDTEDFTGMDDPRLLPLWRKAYKVVREAGNVSYWSILANAGVLPDRHDLKEIAEIDPQDERLHDILRAVAEVANDNNMCSVYDQMAREVGFPDRDDLNVTPEQDYNVTAYMTLRVPVSTSIRARSADEASENVGSEYFDLTGSGYVGDHFIDLSDAEIDWEGMEVEEA